MLSQELMAMKVTDIVILLSVRLDVSTERALDLFFTSNTCLCLHNPATELYLMGDRYIVDDVMAELQKKQRGE